MKLILITSLLFFSSCGLDVEPRPVDEKIQIEKFNGGVTYFQHNGNECYRVVYSISCLKIQNTN